MAYQAWLCEACRAPHARQSSFWLCPGCEKETCDSCFDRYAHCKACAAGRGDEELRLAANAAGYYFDPKEPPKEA